MFASSEGRKSVDSLSSPAGVTHRPDFPFHKQYPRQRRGSVASSVTSIGGSLDTALGSGWSDSVQETGQNAISTLLQPPIVRTGLQPHTAAPASSTHKPPTSKDIPPVALTNVDHIEASEFASYLKQVGALHEQLRRVKESEDEQAATTVGAPRRTSSKDDLAETDGYLRPGSRRTSATRKSSISSLSSANLADAQSPVRRSSSNFRRANQGPPPLSTIPNVYFDEDFHLENPRTFDIVSERSEVVPPSTTSNGGDKAGSSTVAPRKALGTNAILQEKLSWYMDTVEMHLISSISTASTAFFTALGSLKELHTEAADSVSQVKSIRAQLNALDDEIAVRGLDILQKQRRRQNIQQFHATVLQLQDVVNDMAECDALVTEGDVDKALEGITALEKLIAGEQDTKQAKPRSYPLRDLRGATALQGVNSDLSSLRYRIGKAYESKLVSVLMKDIREHAKSFASHEVLMRWNSASVRARGGHGRDSSAFPAYLASTEELKSELLPILTGLYKANHIPVATQAFREAVLREIRSVIRRPLPSSSDDDNESVMSSSTMGSARAGGSRALSQQERSSALARNLRTLEREDAEELLVKIYTSVTEVLRRSTTQARVLLDVASSVGDDEDLDDLKSPPFSPSGRQMQQISNAGMAAQEQVHTALDINSLVIQAVDVAQEKIVRILRVRTEQSEGLPLVPFLRYFTLNLHFANECEAISGRSGTALKNVVNTQIKEFLRKYSDAEKQKLAQEMEKDQWSAKDFTDHDNEVLQRVLGASTKDADVWTADIRLWEPVSSGDSGVEKDTTTPAAPAAASGKQKARTAVIDTEPFAVPTSAVLCLEGMSEFMHLAVAIPIMTPDVASAIVQYLQIFNSRCTQMVLGAGARISAGLKNITTKHLAIASQALSFIATIIPYVREFIRRRAASVAGAQASGLMGDFDKVRRLFQEHQNTIFDKVVEIMSSRAKSHAATMAKLDWDNDEEAEGVHPYMATLAKQTTLLHRNLAEVLPDHTARFIMVSVFASYTEHIGEVLKNANVKTRKGHDNMLRDMEHFQIRLAKIDGFDSTGEGLLSIVQSKNIEAPAPALQPAPQPAPAPAPAPALAQKPTPPLPAATSTAPAERKTSPDSAATVSAKGGALNAPVAKTGEAEVEEAKVGQATAEAIKVKEKPSGQASAGESDSQDKLASPTPEESTNESKKNELNGSKESKDKELPIPSAIETGAKQESDDDDDTSPPPPPPPKDDPPTSAKAQIKTIEKAEPKEKEVEKAEEKEVEKKEGVEGGEVEEEDEEEEVEKEEVEKEEVEEEEATPSDAAEVTKEESVEKLKPVVAEKEKSKKKKKRKGGTAH